MICKHCGLEITQDRPGVDSWTHAEGPQKGLHRCALPTYGYDAEPIGTECSFACLGSKDTAGERE